MLVSDSLFKRLDMMTIQSRKAVLGQYGGERKSKRKGSGIEFADFRSYSSGDDVRRIDWNTYARTGSLFLKLFAEELELPLNIIVDSSASMHFGTPTKLNFASTVAEALSYVSLSNSERVRLMTIGNEFRKTGFKSTKSFLAEIDLFLSAVGGGTVTKQQIVSLSALLSRRHMVLLISDLLWSDDWQEQIKRILSTGVQMSVIQVLSEEELDPSIYGDFRLIDSETGQAIEVSLGQLSLKKYRNSVNHRIELTKSFCLSHDITYAFAVSSDEPENFLLKTLRETGIII
ncbi:MAG: DUF58 domain-containing protein [Planctomycetes bacterium]|nr:DUF58 domain-containing protein [Planctomycetota bacterium]